MLHSIVDSFCRLVHVFITNFSRDKPQESTTHRARERHPSTSTAVPDPPGMLAQHLDRVSAFLNGTLLPYPREEVRDTHGAKARRVFDTGLRLLKYYNPLVRQECASASGLARVHVHVCEI